MRHRTASLFIDRLFLTTRTLAKSAAVAFGAWETHEMVKALAEGKVDWNAVFAAVLNGGAANGIMVTVTTLALGVAGHQIWLRRTITSQQSAYIKKLEQIVDPNRTGSKLLPDGKTRKEDKDDA
jgi:hypothetical protein